MEEHRHTATETVRLGKEIYEKSIRREVENVHDGRFLVVDVTTGAYEVADDELTAFDRAQKNNPGGVFYLLRVGRNAAHRVGGRIIANPTQRKVMRGSVNAEGSEAVLAVRVFDSGGDDRVVEVEAVIDTGFTGHLTLPPNMVESLALPHLQSEELVLADGSMEVATVHRAAVIWHGRRRAVPVHAVPGDALLGMAMLSGSRLQLDAAPGGEVTVEEMSQAAH